MEEFITQFRDSLETGFVNKDLGSELLYQPKLLVNSKLPRRKILSSLLWELQTCESFFISVAFVTTSGVATLINTLQELEEQNIKGKIVVSQYLNFTQPEALKRLLQFKNIELRIATNVNAHSKGYLFKKKNHYNLIVGSSNLTQNALAINKEWNLQVSATVNSKIVEKVYKEFLNDFNSATIVDEDFIDDYAKEYNQKKISLSNVDTEIRQRKGIQPNQMQINALENLNGLRYSGQNKALIISATGTGKTYLSAFDALSCNPIRLLFVVHRLNIAKKAMSTFKEVFGNKKIMGIYSGSNREINKEFLFSTIQTISKDSHLKKFSRDHFDYIIIDESHRSGAQSYINLIEYFKPKFLLGMTATPERTDEIDIFSLFDHNIAYEIRLNSAMEENMLCPFHYYGVSDLYINDEEQEDLKLFNSLISDERVEKILTKSRFYGTDNGICRGLIFVSKVDEALVLSKKFNKKGVKSIALSGSNSIAEREKAIELLESENESERIDFIFSVDIFNEGIDIPKVNQIIMLRPTESAIIFVQQLGRGLRKLDSKSYLTVIDFIGNHNNNYLIPVALYGDTSYNKDKLRKLISSDSLELAGASTINFDKVSKDHIFEAIDSANMSLLRDLKKDYSLLKFRLGRIPMMMDFIKSNSRDPFLFVKYSKSHYNFIKRVDSEFKIDFNKDKIEMINLFSQEINNGKRIEESIILRELLNLHKVKIKDVENLIKKEFNYNTSKQTIQSALINLNFKFIKKDKKIVSHDSRYIMRDSLLISILKDELFADFLKDTIDYSIYTYREKISTSNYKDGFLLHQKYSRKDVCRILNWDKDISSTVYGYRTIKEFTPCFVTYHKDEDVEDSINYNDHFISPSIFAWESRSNRKIESPEIQKVIKSKRILLFVKKADSEGTEFYYMGDVSILKDSILQANMPDSGQPVVHFKFKLRDPVSENLYSYITDKHQENLNSKVTTKHVENNVLIENDAIIASLNTFRLPFYDLYAAAGSFSEMQTSKEFRLIDVPEKFNKKGYFAFKVIGDSMNRRIPNGSICIFKEPVVGSRVGKILLIEYYNKQDADLHSHFTVKTYASNKVLVDGIVINKSIILKPNSTDSSYKEIVITEDDVQDNQFNVVGEFIGILE